MKLLTRLAPFAAFMPFLAFAQETDISFFEGIIDDINTLVDALLPLVMGLALLFFLWGVFVYFIFGASDEEKRETGKKFMIYALVGLVLMVAVWGIVQLLINILGVDQGTTVETPPRPS
jgi:hypothetical protein